MKNSITVAPMTESHIPQIVGLLQAHLELISYPFDMDDETLSARVRHSLYEAGGLSGGEFASHRRFQHWVALREGEVIGALFAYAATLDRPKEDLLAGQIAWMIHDPRCAEAGAVLLKQAAGWLGDDWQGAEAFSLANSLGWAGGLPTKWDHIHAALLQFGFEPVAKDWLMWGEIAAPASLEPGTFVQPVSIQGTRAEHEWKYEAFLSGAKVGELSVQPMDQIGWTPTWDRGWWIDWVEVDEPHRGKGIAKQLFLEMARDLDRHGYGRIAGYTSSPQAAALNRWIGMNQAIEVRSYRRAR